MYCSPSICSFEVQDGKEGRPPGVLDGLRQMMILHQIADLQVLMIDDIVGARQLKRRFVMEVRSLTPHRLMRLRQYGHSLTAAVAALLPPGHPALALSEIPFGFAVAARVEDARAIREGSKGFSPKVDAHLLPRRGKRLYGHIGAREGHVPASGFF